MQIQEPVWVVLQGCFNFKIYLVLNYVLDGFIRLALEAGL